METINKTDLGNRITKLREAKKEKQSDLLDVLGYTKHQQVSYIENGNENRNLSLSQIISLAKHFDVSADYLLGLSDAPTSDKDLQFICDNTGLRIETINQLIELKNNNTLGSGDNIPLDLAKIVIDQLVINQETSRFIKGGLSLANKLANKAKKANDIDISENERLVYDAEELFKSCLGEIFIIQNSINMAINDYFGFSELQKEYNNFLREKNHIQNKLKKAGEDNEKE